MDVKPYRQAIQSLSGHLRDILLTVPLNIQAAAREIRLRRGRPLIIQTGEEIYFLLCSGGVTPNERTGICTLTGEQMEECFRVLCEYSIHSYEKEIRQGYITVEGGHRAGISGTAIISNNEITGLRDISSINLRIARQIDSAASDLIRRLQNRLESILIIGTPASGKTTMLKDLVRKISSGDLCKHRTVSVVDSRGEIAAMYKGVPQNNLGPMTDVLDGYPKGEGMMIAIRSLSPDILVCDEIGGKEEAQVIAESLHAGVRVIATAHAASVPELLHRKHIAKLIELRAFSFLVVLEGKEHPCKIKEIVKVGDLYDKNHRNDPDCGDNLCHRDFIVSKFIKKSTGNRIDFGAD